jgi:hypothetical protein
MRRTARRTSRTPAPRRPGVPKRSAPVGARVRRGPPPVAVEKARRDLDRAAEGVRAAAAALAQVSDRISAEALEGERALLAGDLASEQVLRDLLKLQRAFASVPEGTLPSDLEVLRKLPDAVLDWAQRRLGVSAHLTVGQELEIPPDRLAAFLLDGTLPRAERGLVRVRVVSPGWKRGAKVLVPPRAIII